MELYLIRHTSVDVPSGVCYGQSDVPLKDSFIEEAAITASKIHTLSFDAVFTSPLSRCVRLADYCGYRNAVQDARIKEINFGDWELCAWDAISDPQLQRWYDDYLHVQATNGESFMMQLRRVSEFLDELRRSPYRRVALFTHGGVLLCAQIYAGLIKPEDAFRSVTPYGGMIHIYL